MLEQLHLNKMLLNSCVDLKNLTTKNQEGIADRYLIKKKLKCKY